MEMADKERIARIADFMRSELDDVASEFQGIDYKSYLHDRNLARNLERCLENIVNSSLDAAKIILVNEKLPIPDTYREYFLSLISSSIIDENTANKLSEGVRLRNVLAHQYLDLKWDRIKKFVFEDWKYFKKFLEVVESYVK